MLRNLRWLVAVEPIAAVFGGRPTSQRFFGAAILAMGALVPAGLVPLPTAPVQPAAPAPLAAGAVLTAVDYAGHQLASADFTIYRAEQPDGVQVPLLNVPVPTGGQATIPLPAPSAIPDAASNYYAVSAGLDASGKEVAGIEFFDLIAEHPVTNATITPNLFQVPPVSVQVGVPPYSGPCGLNPDEPRPPGPYFTIVSQGLGVQDGTVDVGAAHGTGYFGGSSYHPENLKDAPYQAMGEELVSEWARATESSVVFSSTITGKEEQTPYQLAGNLHFHLGEGDVSEASRKAYVDQAGQGARALVVAATWEHNFMTFKCNQGEHAGESETHELWAPHEWNPHVSTDTPSVYDGLDSQSVMQQQPLSLVFPNAANQEITVSEGLSQVYESGVGFGVGSGPSGLGVDIYSQSTYAATHEVTIWSGGECGTRVSPTCFYWAMNTAAALDCPYQLACGTDYYTGTKPRPSTTPDPEPQPCSRFAPHGGTC